jgi:hypothetical protein
MTVQWNAVPAAQAYYLYVGTTVGAKDVVNTGEIQQTSRTTGALPGETTLYLRLWTKVGGIWRYSDSTVTTSAANAQLITPSDGAQVYPIGMQFTWNPVGGVQAYYLYVGTTPGATDVVNSGEIQSTSYTATLPESRTLYPRLWTKRNNLWQYVDTTLTTTAAVARLTAPAAGAQSVPTTTTFQWTSVPGAQAYYLYVGTTAGANDVVNSGETQQTGYAASNLPAAQTLHARMWTKIGGIWRSSDTTFSTAILVAQLIAPADNAVEVPLTATFTWTSVPGAEKYYLYVGTSPGLNDVVNSGETNSLIYTAPLPEYTVLHARIQTRAGGIWRYSDSTFTTTRTKARFVHPTDKAIGVDLESAIEWTPVAGATAYRLTVSGNADLSDTFIDSGETTATTWPADGLPSDRPLYARLRSRIGGTWRFTDIVFTAEAVPDPAAIVAPVDTSTSVLAGVPFQWSAVPVGDGYRLRVGTTPGGSDVHDSGTIRVNRRLVGGMPAGVPLYGRISTRLGGNWIARDFTFTVADPAVSTAQRIAFAEWATGEVRRMAGLDNVPAVGSRLASIVSDLNYLTALCTDYAAALVAIVPDLNVGLTVRRVDVAFLNLYEAHTLDELLDPDTGRWVILDPTFGLSARRSSDGAMATAEDLQAATVGTDWSAIAYAWHTAAGDGYVRAYYLDYPLLFLRVFHAGQPFSEPEAPEIAAFVETMNGFVTGVRNVYVVRCGPGTSSASVAIDGASTTVSCSLLNRYSAAFYATTVDLGAGSPATLYRLRRFVF